MPVVSTDRKWDRRWKPWKFHFAKNIFILNWASVGATERKKCKKLQFPGKGPGPKVAMRSQDALKSKEVFVPGRGYLKRASVPSVPKKLSHNGLGACESVPESVLSSVPDSGARTTASRGPPAGGVGVFWRPVVLWAVNIGGF